VSPGEEARVPGPLQRDPGLARERTELAWNRSGIAVLVAVAVMVRRLWPLDGYRSVLALALIAFGAAAWALGMRLANKARRTEGSEATLSIASGRALTAGTLVLALAAFVLGAIVPG